MSDISLLGLCMPRLGRFVLLTSIAIDRRRFLPGTLALDMVRWTCLFTLARLWCFVLGRTMRNLLLLH